MPTDRKQKGASAVEYVVLLTLITLVIIVTVDLLGSRTQNAFEAVEPAFPGGSSSDASSSDGSGPDGDKCGDKDSDDDEDCGKGNDD